MKPSWYIVSTNGVQLDDYTDVYSFHVIMQYYRCLPALVLQHVSTVFIYLTVLTKSM